MEVEIGSVSFVPREGEEWNKHEGMLTNKYETCTVISKLLRWSAEIETDYQLIYLLTSYELEKMQLSVQTETKFSV